MDYSTGQQKMQVENECVSSCKHRKRKDINDKTALDIHKNANLNDLYNLVDQNENCISKMICYEPKLECAEKITDMTILLAKSLLTGTKPELQPEYEKFVDKETIWPRSGLLTMISGLQAVDDYIKSLEYDTTLKYCINFIHQLADKISSTYVYEVKWSIPLQEEPVQLATAHMYFHLKEYFSHPPRSPIDVTYSYEYSSLVFKPGEVKLKENWLLNIMEAKTEFRINNGFTLETFQ